MIAFISSVLILLFSLGLVKLEQSTDDNGHDIWQSPSHHRRSHHTPIRRVQRSYDGYPFALGSTRVINCYSCMSKRLDASWDYLKPLYRKPEQFSEFCDPSHFRRGIVKLRNCTDYCMWIRAETQVMGQRIPVYTRGCMSDVLNYRQEDMRMSKLRRKGGCMKFHLTELFENGETRVQNNEQVELCACHSSYCNGAHSGTSMASFSSTLPSLNLIFSIFLISGFWRCMGFM